VRAARAAQDSLRLARERAAVQQRDDSMRNALAQARVDSIERVRLADTIKAPFAFFEEPRAAITVERTHWSRQEVLRSGAVNLVDLLDRVPGVTSFRTGWLGGAHFAALNGDFQRIRLFIDGVERDPLDARQGGVTDLIDVPLWTVDAITVERGATELRVWIRTWTVRRTTPYTRVDIYTGDLNTNGFRAHFAKRLGNGVALQFVGEQLATQTGRLAAATAGSAASGAGDGTVQLLDFRVGWARRLWTVDMHGTGISRERDPQTARENFTDLPATKTNSRDAYIRVAYGDSARGLFVQALSGALRTRLQGIPLASDTSGAPSDSARSRTQHVLTMGYRADRWRASVTDRARPIGGALVHAPLLRASAEGTSWLMEGFAEQRGHDSLRVSELLASWMPTTWLSLTSTAGRRARWRDTTPTTRTFARADLALRWHRLWIGGGVMREDSTTATSPVAFGAPAAQLPALPTTGLLGFVRGGLYKDIRIDVQALRWNTAQYTRPRVGARTELILESPWLSRFPKGEFGINLRLQHTFRDPVPFYWTSTAGALEPRVADDAQVVSALLEIRIQSATLFYQYRNLTGRAYEQIPGLTMPPAVQLYGVRWEFWN
jgi:hypothetical protein